MEQVVQGLEAEGAVLLASPARAEELRSVAARAGPRRAEVVEKGTRWPVVRVFQVGDAVYFLFFDTGAVMRDFSFAPARRTGH